MKGETAEADGGGSSGFTEGIGFWNLPWPFAQFEIECEKENERKRLEGKEAAAEEA